MLHSFKSIPSETLSSQLKRLHESNTIKLVVCDMHGTTISDNGMSKKCFRNALKDFNMEMCLQSNTMFEFRNKYENITHGIHNKFEEYLYNEYYNHRDQLKLINSNLGDYFENLRTKGIKVALNTEFSPTIQWLILDVLKLDVMVDSYISAENVTQGRPHPYMIHQLMKEFGIDNPKQVCKIGDTEFDVEEGNNAGCGLVVSVLTGDCDESELENKKQHLILENITSLRLV